MAVAAEPVAALRWDGARLELLDQRRLPHAEVWLTCTDAAGVTEAIRTLAVRGAPNIGIAAAYGVALELHAHPGSWPAGVQELRGCRPTAVNLAWAVDRVLAVVRDAEVLRAPAAPAPGPATAAASIALPLRPPPVDAARVARQAAERLHADEDAASQRVAAAGADWLQAAGARRILTHCNTGVLACAAGGSALGCALELARRTPGVTVLAAETRPLLQGARLTVWELARARVDHALIADGAAAGLIARGEVDAVIVGTDRVAANGDVANKVGTYAHALAARAAGIPLLVAGPTSSIDPTLTSGAAIAIEERDADEVRRAPGGELLTLPDTPVRNPAFDVTPAALVTALITECGTAEPPTAATIAALLSPS